MSFESNVENEIKKLYWHDEKIGEAEISLITKIQTYCKRNEEKFNFFEIRRNLYFNFDFDELNECINVKEIFNAKCEELLNCLEYSMHTHLLKLANNSEFDKLTRENFFKRRINCRLFGKFNQILFKDIKASLINKFVTVHGTVIKVNSVKARCTNLTFRCEKCLLEFNHFLLDECFAYPNKCGNKECKGKKFTPLFNAESVNVFNWQIIGLQEIENNFLHSEVARVPRTIICFLFDEMVDTCFPGDKIIVNGIIKTQKKISKSFKKGSNDCEMFSLYLKVVSIQNNRYYLTKQENDYSTSKSINFIKDLHSQENLFSLLVASLCPSIFGHEIEKAGILLSLFGGTEDEDSVLPTRKDIHVLLVGDPGIGKSQILQSVSRISPRGTYVCGNTSTSVGLTVTVSKESNSDFCMEAGALVLSDNGVCCIDEFDKMSCNYNSLLEAMEQQSVSIAKAGIVCSLPCRTSIIAVGNPVKGHYDRTKSVSENLKMSSAILSRFDLVFILIDDPNEEKDKKIARHVSSHHNAHKCDLNKLSENILIKNFRTSSLKDKLSIKFTSNDILPPQLLKIYIKYARKFVLPKISRNAGEILKAFYLKLRKDSKMINYKTITLRQFESLIRLTQARAKLELREECSEQDANDVIEIMKYSMKEIYSNENGLIDFSRSLNNTGALIKSKPKKFLSYLEQFTASTNKKIFSAKELSNLIKESQIDVKSPYDLISTLNYEGFLIKKENNLYELSTK